MPWYSLYTEGDGRDQAEARAKALEGDLIVVYPMSSVDKRHVSSRHAALVHKEFPDQEAAEKFAAESACRFAGEAHRSHAIR